MSVRIALAGNPNSGKTTLFNALTGSNQFVGNWPGVTVEKKEGRLKGYKDVAVIDLPGIYSLSPYSLEEVVARNYLIEEQPDVIMNIIDGTNLERNLYLTTQLMELGIPVIIAVNMIDVAEKKGDKIHIEELSRKLGCDVVGISALKGTGVQKAAEKAISLTHEKNRNSFLPLFSPAAAEALKEIENRLGENVPNQQRRFFALKLLEKDNQILIHIKAVPDVNDIIAKLEEDLDDDAESIITNERYMFISSIIRGCVSKATKGGLTASDKIDKIVTNRFWALPIFIAVMFIVYYFSISTVGTWTTDWVNDGVFGDGWDFLGIGIPSIPALLEMLLQKANCAGWLQGLILNGIVAGLGAVLGFVPQMLVLFFFLAFLENCGYMARVAFIMDRIFRKFGLSGKSFIPMLIGTGCGVPGIMASRTIENDRDRKMTIMTTTFIPCSAKLPITALIAGALFQEAWWVAPSTYFVGISAVICSGIILKKTKMFAGDPAPFVIELPVYHMPAVSNILRSMWERGWSFIKKAGTVILLSTIVIWFATYFGFVDRQFRMLEDAEIGYSILAAVGNGISWLFAPLGWGDWRPAVAAITGFVAKENVVGTFGILFGFAEVTEEGEEIWGMLAGNMTMAAAYSFLVFNLLCAPCFAAMGAIKREMNCGKWFWFAIGYQTALAYSVSFGIYQIGTWFFSGVFGSGTIAAFLLIACFVYLLARPYRKNGAFKPDLKFKKKMMPVK